MKFPEVQFYFLSPLDTRDKNRPEREASVLAAQSPALVVAGKRGEAGIYLFLSHLTGARELLVGGLPSGDRAS